MSKDKTSFYTLLLPRGDIDTLNMDAYRATALAEGFEQGTEEEITAAWQYLHDTGLAYRLQGWFGRQAQSLLAAGVIVDNKYVPPTQDELASWEYPDSTFVNQ